MPLFHANAWSLPYITPLTGCKFILPGAKLDGASIYELLETEKVTFTAAVPTVWLMLLSHMRDNNLKLSTLKRVVIGGSAVPEAVLRAFEEDYGIEVIHAWGMTEMSPMGTLGKMLPEIYAADRETQLQRAAEGRGRHPVQLCVDTRELGHAGEELLESEGLCGHGLGRLAQPHAQHLVAQAEQKARDRFAALSPDMADPREDERDVREKEREQQKRMIPRREGTAILPGEEFVEKVMPDGFLIKTALACEADDQQPG